MKKLIFLSAIIAACLLEATVLNYFRVFNVKPNILLAASIIASLIFSANFALMFSIISGFLKDIFCSGQFGFNSLLFALWSFLVIRLSKKITLENNFIRLALILIAVILNSIATKFVFSYSGKIVPLGIFLRITFLESIYTLFISYFVFRAIRPILQS